MSSVSIGDKLVTIVPVAICEETTWEPGTVVEVVEISPEPYKEFGRGFELQDSSGVIASFAEIDISGEHAWFRSAT
jgi:hypothetical protein